MYTNLLLTLAKCCTSDSQPPAKKPPEKYAIMSDSARTADLKVAADIVVKYLTPYYKEGRFASKVGIADNTVLLL